jgi:hypothetical protein
MKAIRVLFLMYIFCFLVGCHGQTGTNSPDSTVTPLYYPRKDDLNISLVKLLACPERYDGQFVRVIGYLNLEFEGDALYLHKEDYDASISKNGLWINITRDSAMKAVKYNKKYVIIQGVFDTKDCGHMGMFSGALKHITRLDFWYQAKGKQ